uniref:Thaumatin-like protein n=1 Tax=Panagrolaimus sp. ES5 TaxID=591445 RepID=A0AC34FYF7_9BILA
MSLFKVSLLFVVLAVYANAKTIKLQNNCQFTIWPGWWGKNDIPNGGGMKLDAGQSFDLNVKDDWDSGRIWARTGCDDSFACETGSCGNAEKCDGKTGEAGVTLAEFTLNPEADNYDVSNVDGFNIQVVIQPNGENCKTVGECNGDVLGGCPDDLKVVKNDKPVQCTSDCTKNQSDEACCRGSHDKPETCPPTDKTKYFKEHCPTSYAYAYDDKSSLIKCKVNDYLVTFC